MILSALASIIVLGAFAQNKLNLGGDISMLPEYERVRTPYKTALGTNIPNVLNYLKNTGKMNSMRVRLFVAPDPAEAQEGVVQDLEYVMKLGKRIKAAGLDFMLDFHYSDTWADPSHQSIPASWTETGNTVLTDSMYSYTKRCLEYLVANEATPDFVQIGNEISYGMLWRNNNDRCYSSATNSTWKRLTNFLSSAATAVREVTPDAKIILHIERSGDANTAVSFFNKMKTNSVDYDIIGLSYYPFWHKSLSTLSGTLTRLATTFPEKPVQIVETAYYNSNFPVDDSSYENTTTTWPDTPEGQAQFISDLCTELANHDNVTGLYYWFPEENGNGGATYSESTLVYRHLQNRGLWDKDTHKVLPALSKMQEFITNKEALNINSMEALPTPEDAIYNMCGQRMQSMSAPGFYICQGKKYLKN